MSQPLKQSSLAQYKKRMEFFKTLGIIPNQYNKVIKIIETKYPEPRTQKTYLSSILALWKHGHLTLSDNAKSAYKIKVFQLKMKIEAMESRQVKTAKQKQHWPTDTWMKRIAAKLDYDFEGGKLADITKDDHWALQQWVIFHLYTDLPPIRNDYADVLVTNVPHTRGVIRNEYNVSTGIMAIRDFKTNKTCPPIITKLPVKLAKRIKLMMKWRHHLGYNGKPWLLVGRRHTKLSRSKLTELLNDIFEKKIGSTMLRSYFLSKSFPVSKSDTMQERLMVSKKMGNTPSIQHVYIKK